MHFQGMKCLRSLPATGVILLLAGQTFAQTPATPSSRPAPPPVDLAGDLQDMLGQIDVDQVNAFLANMQQQFDGTNIYRTRAAQSHRAASLAGVG